MRKLHNAWFRTVDGDKVVCLIYSAAPVTDLRTFGFRTVQEAEQVALAAEQTMRALLCSICEL